jgi:histidinol-phosphate phosphatase family protein
MTRAIFLDRDGTLVDDPGFLRDPADVKLFPAVPAALAALASRGYRLVITSNQSGIARGIVTPAQVAAVNAEIGRQLAEHGVVIDGWYHCPHHPDAGCACRKPGTAMHRDAARALAIDLAESWCVGDRLSDLQPAAALGGRAVLVRTGEGLRYAKAAMEAGHAAVEDLCEAAALILGG